MEASNLLPWQQRLLAEHDELQGKLNKLHVFLATPESDTLDDTDRMLLGFQGMMMENYLSVLAVRIQRFTVFQ